LTHEVGMSMATTRAVITGGASGIGAATARRIVAAGGCVGILDLNLDAANRLAGELGARAAAVSADVQDEDTLAEAAAQIERAIGAINALVCCAGIPQVPTPIEDWPAREFRRIVDSHLVGTYATCRVVGSKIAAGEGGAIVNLASVVAVHPGPVLAYSAAKAGIASLTQSLAVHWATRNVRVNAVAPGWTDTPFLRPKERKGERDLTPILAATPMRRLMQPEEIADVIAFLLSPKASGITGVVLPCDGGVLAGAGWSPFGGFGATQERAEQPS
jgi:NAD(P)-dependent dehydrogenase (short-subunit alcohol dehydrogenase family)